MGIPPDDTRGSGGIFAKSQRRHLIPASSIELLSKEICAALQSGESGRAAAALAKQLTGDLRVQASEIVLQRTT